MDEDLETRVRRLYAAIGEVVIDDMSRFAPVVGQAPGWVFMYQDWRGGLSDEQLSNLAHAAINNVANLRNHLYAWVGRQGRSKEAVTYTVRQSFELQVLIDLANNERHGYPPKPGQSQSGRCPRLTEVKRVLRLSTGISPNSIASITMMPMPTPMNTGSGSTNVIVTGTVLDQTGLVIGDLYDFLEKGVKAWEALLPRLGLHL
ncbi:MAG: hypothetical protein LAP85_27270 [Acidobacteriia bacterium]|nr:hypothetical protein [Terriglobia bacterium]